MTEKREYTYTIWEQEDGRAKVGCDKPIPSGDTEAMITHILLASWCTKGSNPFLLLCSALSRCNDAMRGEWAEDEDTRESGDVE